MCQTLFCKCSNKFTSQIEAVRFRPVQRPPMHLDTAPFHEIKAAFNGPNFRVPKFLRTQKIDVKRVCLVGSCLLGGFHKALDCPFDLLPHHGGVPPAIDPTAYEFIVLQVPLRVIVRDTDLLHVAFHDHAAYEALIALFEERLRTYLAGCFTMVPDHQTPIFVLNFLVPTRNPVGGLQPKYANNNLQQIVHRLNATIESVCQAAVNKHVVDLDDIANTFGKRYFSDEFTAWYSHGGLFPFFNEGLDGSRMEQSPHTVEHFELLDSQLLLQAAYQEMLGHLTVLRGVGQVKLVVVDLDDTLWKGIAGELAVQNPDGTPITETGRYSDMIEGWPMGVIEGLLYFKKRGGLLAIISRNSEDFIRTVFPLIFRGEMTLDDFAAVKINQGVKAENMQSILQALNLLPSNVVYIDDNPVERGLMDAAFPDIRITGRYFQYLRPMLFGAPEMQVAHISQESAQRTQMVQQQVQRQAAQQAQSPAEFLRSLDLQLRFYRLEAAADPALLLRAIELINKTNQWNSTGAKVDAPSLNACLARGGALFGASVRDRFTHYGDVLFAVVEGASIGQLVMSCRVAGLGVEVAFLRSLLNELGTAELQLQIEDTGRNAPMRLFAAQFRTADSRYAVQLTQLTGDAHVALIGQHG